MQNIEEIYVKYFEIVKKYIFCLTQNNDIAEELTQETFYKAVKKIDTFKGECKISTWLCQIAKNLWYNEFKKRKKQIEYNDQQFLEITSNDEIENIIISNEETRDLLDKIKLLDKNTRTIIVLRAIGNMSFKEISNVLGITENNARVVFYRGKEKLKGGDENEK